MAKIKKNPIGRKMEEVIFKDVKVGDYIKAVAEEKLDWIVTYLLVTRVDVNMIATKKFYDFDGEGNFLKMYGKGAINEWKMKLYKLTEKEFISILGKYIITENLE